MSIKHTIKLFLAGFAALLALPILAQNNVEVTYGEKEGQQTVFTGKISFVRNGETERYAWKPSTSNSSNYTQQGRAFDIRNVKSVRRYVEHTSTIKLPKNAPFTLDNVVVVGDEDIISVNKKGQYKTTADYVDAYTKDGKRIYSCWASADSVNRVSPADLNATETAIALLLKLLPIVDEQTTDRNFQHLKDMMRTLDVTKKLANAIDASIVKRGYLELSDIETQYDNAIRKILNLTGIDKYSAPATAQSGKARMPITPVGREYYGRGMRISIDESEWVYSYKVGKNVWRTNITAGNYNRFGYSSIMRGKVDKNGKLSLYENDWTDHLKFIVKPQRVTSSFFDHIEFWKIENWEKIEEFYDQCLIHPVAFSEMTWDEEKNDNVTFDFESASDVVVVRGSLDDAAVFIYNAFLYVAKPILKKIQKKVKKEAFNNLHTELDISEYFVNKMVLDEGFMAKVTLALSDPETSRSEKYAKISKIVLDKFQDYLFIEVETYVQAGIETAMWKTMDFEFISRLQTDFEDAFVFLDKVKKYGDLLLGLLGNFEYGTTIPIFLDFRDPGLQTPDVPGFDM